MRYLVLLMLVLAACTPSVTESPIDYSQTEFEDHTLLRYEMNESLDRAEQDCTNRGGTFDACGSACDEAEFCIQVCVPSCIIKKQVAVENARVEVVQETHEVRIDNYEFNPPVIDVKPGERVVWTNYDSSRHTVTEMGEAFSSGMLAQRQDWEYVFNEPGSYEYFSKPDPQMKGQVVVRE